MALYILLQIWYFILKTIGDDSEVVEGSGMISIVFVKQITIQAGQEERWNQLDMWIQVGIFGKIVVGLGYWDMEDWKRKI